MGAVAHIKTADTILKRAFAICSNWLTKGILVEQNYGNLFMSDYILSPVFPLQSRGLEGSLGGH